MVSPALGQRRDAVPHGRLDLQVGQRALEGELRTLHGLGGWRLHRPGDRARHRGPQEERGGEQHERGIRQEDRTNVAQDSSDLAPGALPLVLGRQGVLPCRHELPRHDPYGAQSSPDWPRYRRGGPGGAAELRREEHARQPRDRGSTAREPHRRAP